MKKIVSIEGMSCNHCVMAVKNALNEIAGVKSVEVDLKGKKAEVIGNSLDDEKIKEAIEDAGYEVVEIHE
jgi:copper chaperone